MLTTIKITGVKAISDLNARLAEYPKTSQYPFLIGDSEELALLEESFEFNEQMPDDIIRASLEINLDRWITSRRSEAEEYEFSADDILGEWPGEIDEKGSISLHKNILNGKIKPEIHLGIASIEEPWHLPAMLKYGAWNDCPGAEIHCAFHRQWQGEFGAQIVGVSHDVIECIVKKPPTDRQTAFDLAWKQYWYCADIVDQGCQTINNLAATLLNSPYWYFWWD
jgi:hypothetical protein